MVPPRPLQATPTPSSGFGVDVRSAFRYRNLPCRARQDKRQGPNRSGKLAGLGPFSYFAAFSGQIQPTFSGALRGWPRAGGGKPPQRPFQGGRLEALWASKSASPTADGKIEDFDAAPYRVVWRALRGEIRNPPWALQVKSLPARGKISPPFGKGSPSPARGIFSSL